MSNLQASILNYTKQSNNQLTTLNSGPQQHNNSISKLRNQYDDDLTLCDRFSSMNDPFTNTTDILHTEIDYCLDEIEQTMICKGKSVEIQCNQLSDKYGLLARCKFISDLLQKANLSESHLNGDPIFAQQNSFALLQFNSIHDAHAFANSNNAKFRTIYGGGKPVDKSLVGILKQVTFEQQNRGTGVSLPVNSNNSNDSLNMISSQAKIDLYNNNNNHSSQRFNGSSSDLLSLSQPQDVFETLTIRAKLRQKVGPQRINHVSLKDIDGIMRQVVTVVQTEFMKKFPSASDSTRAIKDLK